MKTARLWLCTAVLLLFVAALPVSADPVSEMSLSVTVDGGMSIQRNNTKSTFWEFPMLTPGQTRSDGTLTIYNFSDYAADITLDKVDLPYTDQEVLTYLNAVTLVLTWDGQEIFHGRYVDLADFSYTFGTLESEDSLVITVEMRCAFTYTGDTTAVKKPVVWQFDANTAEEIKGQENGFEEDGFVTLRLPTWSFWAAGAAVVLVILVKIIRYFMG